MGSGQSQSKQTSETKVNERSNVMSQVGSSSTTQSSLPKTASTKPASTTKPAQQKKTKRTSVERVAVAREAAENSKETDEFHNICMSVFENADVDRDGQLDKREFFSVMSSSTLGLNLSTAEVEDVYLLADANGDGFISYREFIPVLKKVLMIVYGRTTVDWNDWCKIGVSSSGRTIYLNKRTGEVTTTMPEKYNPERQELHTFQYITLPDGTEVTTYEDDGQRYYLNWEDEKWMPFPEEWAHALNIGDLPPSTQDIITAEGNEFIDDPQQDDPAEKFGFYDHPTRGRLQTYFFENTRYTRLYYDAKVEDWNRMPLFWECNVPEVREMLEAMDAAFPDWGNVNEQLLVLREVNYVLEDAILFSEINFRDLASTKPPAQTSTLKTTSKKSSVSSTQPPEQAAKAFRRATSQYLTTVGEDDVSQGFSRLTSKQSNTNGMSLHMSNQIHDLEMELSAKNGEVVKLSEKIAELEAELEAFTSRSKTSHDIALKKAIGDLNTATEHNKQLKEANEAQKATIAQQQQALLENASNKKKIIALQEQVDSMQGAQQDQNKALLEKTNAQLDTIRQENIVLQSQIQGFEAISQNPFKHPTVGKTLKQQSLQLAQIEAARLSTLEAVQLLNTDILDKFANVRSVVGKLKADHDAKVNDLTAKYRAESLQRKLLYNKVQELRGNIRVFCRCRRDDREPTIFLFPSTTEIMVPSLQGGTKLMDFDRVYDPSTDQATVFEETKPTILSVIDGYNVCIIAYGQTGSGKTHTMTGTKANPGVNRRAIRELLAYVGANKSSTDFTITVSLMEIYNENIFDLLSSKQSEKMTIHQDADGNTIVTDLTVVAIETEDDIEELMALGDSNRSVAATAMNSSSSRSHAILQIKVTGFNRISKVTTFGKLSLVDLAGSERVSKTDATGMRLTEAAAINKSLSSLGQVFKSLAENSPHVPYRNSKLTHVLQDSLGGDSKTCVFVNISPTEYNLAESTCTLNFGRNIRKIELGPAKKNKATLAPPPPPKKA